jgi:aminopeptidase-like protein|tara:strand:+ start:1217 stop:2479 length:1263 start_codon:yes stop_codon:yes gene_type:complete
MKNINLMKIAKEVFPLNRSLTGSGTLKTLKFFKKINNQISIKSVKSGQKVFDWKIPNEWNVNSAYFEDEKKNRYCDFKKNNLNLLGYSVKKKGVFSYNELIKKIHFIKNKPNAIPYVTSYYKKDWGFCLSYRDFKKINKKHKFFVNIDTKLKKGLMHYGELTIKGKSKKQILIVSYICHPSMANNELSGPLVALKLSKILKKSKYTIKIIFIPETIGAIYYIEKNLNELKRNLIAGINLSCVGDNKNFSFISSVNENTYSDLIIKRVLKNQKFKKFNFEKRGSNERQFGCQNLNLPFITLCRSRFGDYKEYHTSLDNLNIISNKSLNGSVKIVKKFVEEIQKNQIFTKNIFCEPFLFKYNLVNNVSKFEKAKNRDVKNICAFTNKNIDTKELKNKFKINDTKLKKIIKELSKKKIIKEFI